MKMNIKSLFLIAAMSLSVFTGCSKDDEKEVKDLIKPNCDLTQPTDGLVIQRGNSLIFEGYFTDDNNLKSCEFTLTTLKGWDVPWEPVMDIIELSGTEQNITGYQVFKETVPVEIMSGDYTLNIRVNDEAGNYNIYSVGIVID